MKRTAKKIEKIREPEFIVNLTDAETPTDVLMQFGLAKHNAGMAITDDELMAICMKQTEMTANFMALALLTAPHKEYVVENGAKLILDEFGNAKIKKPNIFKRFWRWITRKK